MSSPVSSPPRPNKLKTYSGRQKRKRTSATNASGLSESEDMSDIETKDERPIVISGGGKKEDKPITTSYVKTGPKKVEGHLPGPSPKKGESPTLAMTPSGKVTHPGHRRVSSISSRPSPIGALSSISPTFASSQIHLDHPDDDDSSSIAGSVMGVKVRRTESERIQVFKDHPDCGDMEPHRVLCTRCDMWVNLGRKQTYAVRPWERHRERCDRKAAMDMDDDDAASISPSITHSEYSARRTESERQGILERDPRAEQVLPHEVLCKKCQKWIKLAVKQRYALGNWNAHQQRCSGSLPSSRVSSAERKLKLVNDFQAKTFDSRNVECANCGDNVALSGEYLLTNWDNHKKHCPITPSTPRIDLSKVKKTSSSILLPSVVRPISSSSLPRGSPSATSDDTLIASEGSPGLKLPRKRAREDEDEEDRPYNRPRTENYVVPDKDAPGPWGWFLMPFQTFISGFREGMRSSAA